MREASAWSSGVRSFSKRRLSPARTTLKMARESKSVEASRRISVSTVCWSSCASSMSRSGRMRVSSRWVRQRSRSVLKPFQRLLWTSEMPNSSPISR